MSAYYIFMFYILGVLVNMLLFINWFRGDLKAALAEPDFGKSVMVVVLVPLIWPIYASVTLFKAAFNIELFKSKGNES
ncbi:MAG: hypothetical protein GY829_13980 [Gammaproteobacteria bacterium]|nr:hypothetical protein [Gammaproteobacteria bacterium]